MSNFAIFVPKLSNKLVEILSNCFRQNFIRFLPIWWNSGENNYAVFLRHGIMKIHQLALWWFRHHKFASSCATLILIYLFWGWVPLLTFLFSWGQSWSRRACVVFCQRDRRHLWWRYRDAFQSNQLRGFAVRSTHLPMLKSSGERTHPCNTPIMVENQLDSSPSTLAALTVSCLLYTSPSPRD